MWIAHQFLLLPLTAAGVACPLHGARAEWPAEIGMLQRGVKCSGSARCSPGPAHERKAISWRIALLSGDHQHHHAPPSGTEPPPPEPGTWTIAPRLYTTVLFCCVSLAKDCDVSFSFPVQLLFTISLSITFLKCHLNNKQSWTGNWN